MVVDRVEMLNKLEFMLMGLRQMNLNSVCAWFPDVKREIIIEALTNSPKFKVDDNIVSLKSETEIYEEELQKDILKDLLGDDSEDDLFADNSFDEYDGELELTEEVDLEPDLIEIDSVIHDVEAVETVEHKEDAIVINGFMVEPEHAALWNEEVTQTIDNNNKIEEVLEIEEEEVQEIQEKEVEETVLVKKEEVLPEVKEERIMKPINNVQALDGANISYEDLLRLIDEYNKNIEDKLNYSIENRREVRAKAIKRFYAKKYEVKLKDAKVVGTDAEVYALINRKKGMEVAYLVVCGVLDDGVLNYVLDHYDEEVVYFCPIDGVEVEFEVGLNEFYLKDTDMIFDKYLEHFVIVNEADKKIKKLEIVVGTNI